MVTMDELLDKAQDTLSGRRVFAEPVHQDGVTVIPAASISGGGGGGGGQGEDGEEGQGGGFGMSAKPAGVYVVRDGEVQWQPAVDVNKLVGTLAFVAVVAFLTRWRTTAIRARAAGDQEPPGEE